MRFLRRNYLARRIHKVNISLTNFGSDLNTKLIASHIKITNLSFQMWRCQLLIKNYYKPKMAVIEWTKRFIYLIKTYSKSYRNFFFYSNKSLSFKDACTIIYEILNQLGMYVLSKSEEDLDESENTIEKPVEKKKRKKTPLSEINGFDSVEKPKPATVKKCAFDDPEVVSGLFDIVTILWVLHDIELNKSENEEMRLKLYDTYIKYAQPFINYYKVCFYFESYFARYYAPEHGQDITPHVARV